MDIIKNRVNEANKFLENGNKFMKTGLSKWTPEYDNAAYQYMQAAMSYVSEIDDNTRQIYKCVRESYSKRFPELSVSIPIQYILIAKVLGNEPEKITRDDVRNQLREVIEPKIELLVSMAAPTTRGVKLEEDEMNQILKACNVALDLTDLRVKLLRFVESNMTLIAPNLSVIVGAPIAAKLMGEAGGLLELATIPSCNLTTLGSHKTSKIESSTSAPIRAGLIYDCDLIQQIPFDNLNVRKRAVKWVANKCVLAARCDVKKSDDEAGRTFRANIEALIDKALEPPPKKAPRPLPAPIEKSGKRRGGKRSRKTRERFAKTELRKAANRINFID